MKNLSVKKDQEQTQNNDPFHSLKDLSGPWVLSPSGHRMWLRPGLWWIFWSGIIISLAALGYLYTRTPDGRLLRDRLLLKVPVLGQCNHLNELVRCCRTMSILYRSGLPVTEIMALVIENSGTAYSIRFSNFASSRSYLVSPFIDY